MARFMDGFPSYAALHRWSVQHLDQFWTRWLTASGIRFAGDLAPARVGEHMPDVRFFPQVTLSFADNLLAHREGTALIAVGDTAPARTLSYADLRAAVGCEQARLCSLGVTAGDRVAGYLPNIPEAVVAMLAASSLGAIWSCCSPDFGVASVLDRFGQIGPKVLYSADGYVYGDKRIDCRARAAEIVRALGCKHIAVSYLEGTERGPAAGAPTFAPFPFNHPLYILYSSGTTGVPKCIVHGQGGTLLQHTKEHVLHCDLRAGDNILYFTTTGWMMWNWLVSALATGATVTLFDGQPTPDKLWGAVREHRVTHFGTSPKFLGTCRKNGFRPTGLDALRVLLSTGAPLLPEDFTWVYAQKADLQLSSISGGTDIISCFMLGNPVLPVRQGEIQCLGLGMDVGAIAGELVCRSPFPSSPVCFWNDDGSRYHAAYFKGAPGVWHHGDFISMTEHGGVIVHGRSDATLNPAGVRIGTAEIYRLVETLPEVHDSIVVGKPEDGDVQVILFVQLAPGVGWSDELAQKIRRHIRAGATPRHVPASILPVPAIPYTVSGKKVELAVLDVLQGKTPRNLSALANPESLQAFATPAGAAAS
jgi:acetoacetyl-CoA synthetase